MANKKVFFLMGPGEGILIGPQLGIVIGGGGGLPIQGNYTLLSLKVGPAFP